MNIQGNDMTTNLSKSRCLQPHIQLDENFIYMYHPFLYYIQNHKFRKGLIQNTHTHTIPLLTFPKSSMNSPDNTPTIQIVQQLNP